MTETEALARMVPPSKRRPGKWRDGVMQIHVTRACNRSCFGCTQGSNLAGKPVMASPDEFELMARSLKNPDYWGVVGMFGGNPCMHPQFGELCNILRRFFPRQQCGLWSNDLCGKGRFCRTTFNPNISNLNVHQDQSAHDEIKRDWPEARRVIKGLHGDSRHAPPYIALKDIIDDEAQRWDMIARCDINRFWSAMLCVVPGKGPRGFFCELAGAQAMLHAGDATWPDLGIPALPGWWTKGMDTFSEQARWYCHRCGIPLRRFGQLANGGEYEEVSVTHADIYQPKEKGRRVALVQVNGNHERTLGRVTDYLQNGGLA